MAIEIFTIVNYDGLYIAAKHNKNEYEHCGRLGHYLTKTNKFDLIANTHDALYLRRSVEQIRKKKK
jgi:hypothetical protein